MIRFISKLDAFQSFICLFLHFLIAVVFFLMSLTFFNEFRIHFEHFIVDDLREYGTLSFLITHSATLYQYLVPSLRQHTSPPSSPRLCCKQRIIPSLKSRRSKYTGTKTNKTKFTTIKPTASKHIIFWTGSIWQVLECFTYLDEQLSVPSSYSQLAIMGTLFPLL